MEWDMKTGSCPWDWDNNTMLFSNIGLSSRNENICNGGSASASASSAMLAAAAAANNGGRGSSGAAMDRDRMFCREEKSSVGRVCEEMKEPKQGDSLVDLKLGRHGDYEDSMGQTMTGTSVVSPVPSKKPRGSMLGSQTPCCQVQGCNADLRSCKDYHRRHKVCQMHSKAAKVRVAGLEQRFCQQCSRETRPPSCQFRCTKSLYFHCGEFLRGCSVHLLASVKRQECGTAVQVTTTI